MTGRPCCGSCDGSVNVLRRRVLTLLGLAIILALCAVVAVLISLSRDRILDNLRRDTRNLTSALALYAGGVVSSIDLALTGARDSLPLVDVRDVHAGERLLREAVSRINLPVMMAVADQRGRILFSSNGAPTVTSLAVDDRSYFVAQQQGDAGLFISEVLVSRVSGKASIVFSRRLTGPEGRFLGVVLVSTPMEVFEDLFKRFDVGQRGSLILADETGVLHARSPPMPKLIGTKVIRDDSAVLTQLRAGVRSGVRINLAPIDGVRRMLGFERVASTRLFVGVGQSLDEHLADWYRDAFVYGTVTVLFGSLAMVVLLWTTRRAALALGRADDLTRAVEERTQALTVALRRVEAADSAKSRFLRSISHELMTPLNGVLVSSQLLQLTGLEGRQRRLLDAAHQSTERLAQTLGELLRYAELASAPDRAPRLECGDLSPVVHAAISEFAVERRSQGHGARARFVHPMPLVNMESRNAREVMLQLLRLSTLLYGGGEEGFFVDSETSADRREVEVYVSLQSGFTTSESLAALLEPFVDPGRTERLGLYAVGVRVEILRLLAREAGAKFEVGSGVDNAIRLSLSWCTCSAP